MVFFSFFDDDNDGTALVAEPPPPPPPPTITTTTATTGTTTSALMQPTRRRKDGPEHIKRRVLGHRYVFFKKKLDLLSLIIYFSNYKANAVRVNHVVTACEDDGRKALSTACREDGRKAQM
jgi:hypothetical protein